MRPKGSILFLLHAHLPYINHPEHADFLEENWFFEGVVETYIPLILMLDRLVRDGIRPGIAISISPTLGAMLENDALEKKLQRYVDTRLELVEKELARVENDPAQLKIARLYAGLYGQAAETIRKYSGDLITPLKQFQHAGHIEIITTSATHAVLPTLAHPEALRAQIAAAADDYFDRFNTKPSGFWLPECAYDPRVQSYLKLSGFKYIFTESHAVSFSDAAPKNGVYASYRTQNGINVFARDAESSKEVWSAKFGYPGDPAYREFYRDLGYDADYDYIKPYLGADGARRALGLKYHRITGDVDLAQKQYYDPDAAQAAVERHAADFLARRMKQVDGIYAERGIRPVIVGCYDAELFGHWWFEGPAFLESVIRRIRQDRLPLQFVTPSEYLNSCPEPAELNPGISSWGENGYFDPWLNESNDSICLKVLSVTDLMIETATRFINQDMSSLTLRALNQAAREVLLAQSSDWPFLVYIRSHSQYAAERVAGHAANASRLLAEALEKRVDEKALCDLEKKNNLFQRMDFRLFASVSKF
jgi:1,4-alpha-glucan branching enzyme